LDLYTFDQILADIIYKLLLQYFMLINKYKKSVFKNTHFNLILFDSLKKDGGKLPQVSACLLDLSISIFIKSP
jgi:hypothetical protein